MRLSLTCGDSWRKLRSRCTNTETRYRRCYNTLEGYVLDKGVGNLEGMGYRNFLDWMKEKRNIRDCIKRGVMKSVKNFVDSYSA